MFWLRKWRSTSIPVMPGIFQSSRMMSGTSAWARWLRAVGPSSNPIALYPASERFWINDSRNIPSSSTITISPLGLSLELKSILPRRQQGLHARSAAVQLLAAAILQLVFQQAENGGLYIRIKIELQGAVVPGITPNH